MRASFLRQPNSGLIALGIFLGALVPTLAFGNGVAYNDSVLDLHVNPVGYIGSLLYAWNPKYFLGMHTGFMQEYLTPYSFAYAGLALLHVPAFIAQRAVMFVIYLAIILSSYISLRYIAPEMHRLGRFVAGLGACWNIYVAFNSHGASVMLLPYAVMPAFVAVYAIYIDRRIRLLPAAAIIAGLSLFASAVNPPLLAIDAAVIAMFVVAAFVTSHFKASVVLRALTLSVAGGIAVLAVNLYWIVPFLDFFHTVWLGGILSESTAMHNASTSFSNTLRGFGQWAIFVGDDMGPYYAWAASYEGISPFSIATWVQVGLAAASLAFRRNEGRGRLFFLILLVCSLPLVVGYYAGPMGHAVTTPVYNFLFTKVPYFEIFRSVYKWESVVVFAVAALAGSFVSGIVTSRSSLLQRRRLRIATCAAALITLSVSFAPVAIYKMNPREIAIPRWVTNEDSAIPADAQTRAALMPSQYLEQFYWGDPAYYLESAIVKRPLVFGYLGSAASEDSDQVLRRAFREARDGRSEAVSVFRLLGVSKLLQRDDFRSFSDFAFPDEDIQTTASQAHDIISRVLRARPIVSDGANKFYEIRDALPLVHGASSVIVASEPSDVVAAKFDASAMAAGKTVVDPSRLSQADLGTMLANGAAIQGSERDHGGLAATMLLRATPHAYSRSGAVNLTLPSGPKRILVNLFGSSLDPTVTLTIDSTKNLRCAPIGGEWLDCGVASLNGTHRFSVREAAVDGIHLLAVPNALWRRTDSAVHRIAASAHVTPVDPPSESWSSGRRQVLELPSRLPTRSQDKASLQRSMPVQLLALPSSGTRITAPLWLPQRFYAAGQTYEYNRGRPQQWFALSGESHFMVLSPLEHKVRASISVPLSLLGDRGRATLRVNGRTIAREDLRGRGTFSSQRGKGIAFALNTPVTLKGTATINQGANDVALLIEGKRAKMQWFSDAASDFDAQIVAASPTVPAVWVRAAEAGISALPGNLAAARIPLPSDRLWGAPTLDGSFSASPSRSQRLFVALSVRGDANVETAVSEVAPNGSQFSISLPDLLANSYTDAGDRVVGAWIIAEGSRPKTLLNKLNTLRYAYAMRSFAATSDSGLRRVAKVFAFRRGVMAERAQVELPAVSWSDRALRKLEVRGVGDGLNGALSLHYNDGKRWRVVGEPHAVTATLAGDGRSSTVTVPDDLRLTLRDLEAQRLSVEVNDVPFAYTGKNRRVDRQSFFAEADPQTGRIQTIVLPSLAARGKTELVDGRGDDLDPSVLVIGSPSSRLNRHPLRLVATFLRDQNSHTVRTFTVTSPAVLESQDALPANSYSSPRPNASGPEFLTQRTSPVYLRVTAERDIPRGTVLVFGESFHPMWRAVARGNELMHVETNGYANGWILPALKAGETITVAFDGQRRFVASALISVTAIFLLATLVLWDYRRARTAREGA